MEPATRQLRELKGLPPNLERLYKQVIEAYNYKLDLLVFAGSRMILEGICDDLEIPSGKPGGRKLFLAERLDLLNESRLKLLAGVFDPVLRCCNLAVHDRQVEDGTGDVDFCIDAAETALQMLYRK